MPRSEKPISSGSLSDPIAPPRSRTWSSRGAPETSALHESDVLPEGDLRTQETVDAVVNLMDPAAPVVTVPVQRPVPRPEPVVLAPPPVYEWTTVRSIDDRTYQRIDERHEVTAAE